MCRLTIGASSFYKAVSCGLLCVVLVASATALNTDFHRPVPLLHIGGLGYHPVAQRGVSNTRRLTTDAPTGSLLSDRVPNRSSSQEMLIASKTARPFSFREPQEGVPAGDDWTGYSWEVFDQLIWPIARAQGLNYTSYRIVEFDDNDQIVQAVALGLVDAAHAALTKTAEREELVDFTAGWFSTGIKILTRVSLTDTLTQAGRTLQQVGGNILNFLLLVACVVLSMAIVLWILERASPGPRPVMRRGFLSGVKDSGALIFLLLAGVEMRIPSGRYSRPAAALCKLGSSAMTVALTAVVTVALQAVSTAVNITSLEDLDSRTVLVPTASLPRDYLIQNAGTANIVEAATVDSALARFASGEGDALFYDAGILSAFIQQQVKLDGFHQYALTSELLLPQQYGIATDPALPSGVREALDKAILATYGSDEVGQLQTKWFGETGAGSGSGSASQSSQGSITTFLSDNIGFIAFAAAIFVGAGLLVGVVALLCRAYRRREGLLSPDDKQGEQGLHGCEECAGRRGFREPCMRNVRTCCGLRAQAVSPAGGGTPARHDPGSASGTVHKQGTLGSESNAASVKVPLDPTFIPESTLLPAGLATLSLNHVDGIGPAQRKLAGVEASLQVKRQKRDEVMAQGVRRPSGVSPLYSSRSQSSVNSDDDYEGEGDAFMRAGQVRKAPSGRITMTGALGKHRPHGSETDPVIQGLPAVGAVAESAVAAKGRLSLAGAIEAQTLPAATDEPVETIKPPPAPAAPIRPAKKRRQSTMRALRARADSDEGSKRHIVSAASARRASIANPGPTALVNGTNQLGNGGSRDMKPGRDRADDPAGSTRALLMIAHMTGSDQPRGIRNSGSAIGLNDQADVSRSHGIAATGLDAAHLGRSTSAPAQHDEVLSHVSGSVLSHFDHTAFRDQGRHGVSWTKDSHQHPMQPFVDTTGAGTRALSGIGLPPELGHAAPKLIIGHESSIAPSAASSDSSASSHWLGQMGPRRMSGVAAAHGTGGHPSDNHGGAAAQLAALDIGPEERLYLKDEQWRLRQQAGIAPVLPPNDLLWLVWERVDMLAQQALLQRAMGRADVPADLEEVEPSDLRTEARAVKKLLQKAGLSSSKARKTGVLVAMAGISDAAGTTSQALHNQTTPGGHAVSTITEQATPTSNPRARNASGGSRRYGGGMGGNGAAFVSNQATLRPPPKPKVKRRLRAADVLKLAKKERGDDGGDTEDGGVMRARRAKKAWMASLTTPKDAHGKHDSLRDAEAVSAGAELFKAGSRSSSKPGLAEGKRRVGRDEDPLSRRTELKKAHVGAQQHRSSRSDGTAIMGDGDSKMSAKPRISREHRASRSGKSVGMPLTGRPRPRPPQAAWGRKARPSQSKHESASRSTSPRHHQTGAT